MKPLELTVYPLRDKVGRNARPGFIVGKRAMSVAEAHRIMTSKRLTDAELAAEYHNMDSDCQIAWIDGEHTEAMQERFETLERFATLPHYDEASL